MSKYTTEVRFICETLSGKDMSGGYNSVRETIEDSWRKIFDFDFPIFDEEYRPVLCKKILMHYYTREIGLETIGLWKLKLETKLNEIMPYYNQLYDSCLLDIKPFMDADYVKTHEGSDAGSNDGNSAKTYGENVKDDKSYSGEESGNGVRNARGNQQSWDVYSDTPQGALTNVANDTYLTNARKVNSSHDNGEDNTYIDNRKGNSKGNQSRSGTDDTTLHGEFSNTNQYTERVLGKFPGSSYSKLLKEFRDTFLNIDMDVIDELGELFIKLW